MWYTSSSGQIELQLTKQQAQTGSHSGPCDNDIAYLRQLPTIKRQLNKLDADTLAKELKEYGCWDETELSNHDENLTRILWIACGDISEGNC